MKWNRVDPNNSQLDRLVMRIMERLAWRYRIIQHKERLLIGKRLPKARNP